MMRIDGSPTAASAANNPAGGISSTDVQSAINELDTEKENVANKDTDGTLAANSDTKYASQKATRTYVNSIADNQVLDINLRQALGSVIKAETTKLEKAAATLTMNNQVLYMQAIWLPKAATITGVKWWQAIQGNYTGNNNSKVGLYTYDGAGNITLVASCANDTALWKVGTQAFGSKAFASQYVAAAGLYFIGILYCQSAETTAPQLVAENSTYVAAGSTLDYTNSAKRFSTKAAQTDLPAGPVAMNTFTTVGIPIWLALY